MPARRASLASLFVFSTCAAAGASAALSDTSLAASAVAQAQAAAHYGKLPLAFEANRGQAAPTVRYLTHGLGYTLFLTPREAILGLRAVKAVGDTGADTAPAKVLRVRLVRANSRPPMQGVDRLPGTSNYFIGADSSRWLRGVPQYARVKYNGVYPGIDLVYYGTQSRLEYDFVVAPGARPERIALDYRGIESLALNDVGDLVLRTGNSTYVQHKPIVYQDIGGERHAIAGRHVLRGSNRVGFALGRYDVRHPLVIDPVLSYSTYLGGSGDDHASGIAVDGAGNAYVTGFTSGADFPSSGGSSRPSFGGEPYDVFVAKFNATGTALVYATFLGGSGADVGTGIAVDASGNAYVTGYTSSTNFPVTTGARQSAYGGGSSDAFVAKLDATGAALMYATYLGGSGADVGAAIAVQSGGSGGSAYVTGFSASADFPTTAGALQRAYGGGAYDSFVVKLDTAGSAPGYATYLGGSGADIGSGIAVDGSGNAYITGYTDGHFPATAGALQTAFGGVYDAFVAKLDPTGASLAYATYLGGAGEDIGSGIAVDSSGNAHVTGNTNGGFPTTTGAYQTAYGAGSRDAFVAKLDVAGTALMYSTYLGGNGYDIANGSAVDDVGNGIALDGAGNAYVTGSTTTSLPTTAGAWQSVYGGGTTDAFVAALNAAGTALVYASYLGGAGSDVGNGVAVDAAGNIYVTGNTTGGFPTTAGAFQTAPGGGGDAFVARFAADSVTLIPFPCVRSGDGRCWRCITPGGMRAGTNECRPALRAASAAAAPNRPASNTSSHALKAGSGIAMSTAVPPARTVRLARAAPP